jgi:Transcription- and export-related complex subunit
VVPATDALRYLTRLSLDAATYCCVTRLSANRQLYDGQNSGPADWLKNLSDCIGNIYKKVSSAMLVMFVLMVYGCSVTRCIAERLAKSVRVLESRVMHKEHTQ